MLIFNENSVNYSAGEYVAARCGIAPANEQTWPRQVSGGCRRGGWRSRGRRYTGGHLNRLFDNNGIACDHHAADSADGHKTKQGDKQFFT